MRHPGSKRSFGIAALLTLAWGAQAGAQCMLANPSFEIAGTGGQVFGGWNQFGIFGSSSEATHGAVAARVSGPDQGGWDVSGYWQSLDSEPGEQWTASVCVAHSSVHPLSGQSAAILNIEWRDAGGILIDYVSTTIADASTPADDFGTVAIESPPAPPGTVSARILLGVLQSPDDPPPDVLFDQATFASLGPPTPDDLQWQDFPSGRTVTFSGHPWRVKGPGIYGPGPNPFCETGDCVWVDGADRLHLTVRNVDGTWYSTEAVLETALGYGDYVFTTRGRLDLLDPNVVFGLFLWEYGPCYLPENGWWNPYNEIDVEFSRWGDAGNDLTQFVAQPFDWPGNIERFDVTFTDGEITSHAFLWMPDRVEYRSWRGGPDDEAPGTLIHTWTYAGPHIPRPEQPRVHLNLWQFSGPPAVDQEVTVEAFTFVPAGLDPHCGELVVAVGEQPAPRRLATRLSLPMPNPFNPRTTLRYDIAHAGHVVLALFDAAGRHVRTLVSGHVEPGTHAAVWDGRDDTGRRVASGVYLERLTAGGITETQRVVLLE